MAEHTGLAVYRRADAVPPIGVADRPAR